MTWLKRHERKLWWGFLVVSMAIGLARNPNCADDVPWWGIALPIAVFVVLFYFQLWQIRKLRERQ